MKVLGGQMQIAVACDSPIHQKCYNSTMPPLHTCVMLALTAMAVWVLMLFAIVGWIAWGHRERPVSKGK